MSPSPGLVKHSGNAARNALEARLGDPNFQNELAHVTTSGDRFTATFASTVRDKQTLRVTEPYPDTVPFCRVAFETRRESPNGNGKSLGTHRYKRKGGTAAAAVGKLSAAGLRELKRKGKLLVDTQLVILPPTGQQGGVHTAKTVTLVAG